MFPNNHKHLRYGPQFVFTIFTVEDTLPTFAVATSKTNARVINLYTSDKFVMAEDYITKEQRLPY